MPKPKKNALNPAVMRRIQSNPQAYTTHLLERSYETSILDQMVDRDVGEFDAICVSGINSEDNTGAGADPTAAKIQAGSLKIVIMPKTGARMPPTLKGLTDPAAINFRIDIMSTNPHYVAYSDYPFASMDSPQFGQIVKCYYVSKDPDNPIVYFKKNEGTPMFEPGYETLGAIEGVPSATRLFDNGSPSQLGQQSAVSSNADIAALAERFDKENSTYKAANNKKIALAHPEFQSYIKAFIIKCKDAKIKISINSTHRNRAAQNKLIAEYNAGTRKIKPASTSYHLVGLAFDFNPLLPNGSWVSSKMSKQTWINSGVPAIGESLGLRWGGHFSTNYDPIHFDLGKKISKTRMGQMVAEANKKGVEGTQIPTGKEV